MENSDIKKLDIPSWHKYFMTMAELAKTKSKDRSTQVGAVVVGSGHTVLSIGYNGFPRGLLDDISSRHERPVKYLFTEHAERNSIYAAAKNGIKLDGSKMYVSCGGVPCADCCRAIIQAGIISVVVMGRQFEGKGSWGESCDIGKTMLIEAGVEIVLLDSDYDVVISS